MGFNEKFPLGEGYVDCSLAEFQADYFRSTGNGKLRVYS